MERTDFGASYYSDVATEIEHGVRISRIPEMVGLAVCEVSFPYRSEIQFHAF